MRCGSAEHRRLQAEGDETLKGTKYLWLYSEENLPESCAGAVRRAALAAPEDRPGLGDQGVAARSVGLPAQGLGACGIGSTGTSGRRTRG